MHNLFVYLMHIGGGLLAAIGLWTVTLTVRAAMAIRAAKKLKGECK